MPLQKERQVVTYHAHMAQFMGAHILIWVLACILILQKFIGYFTSVSTVQRLFICSGMYIYLTRRGLVSPPVSWQNDISCHEGINQMHSAVPQSHYEWPRCSQATREIQFTTNANRKMGVTICNPKQKNTSLNALLLYVLLCGNK